MSRNMAHEMEKEFKGIIALKEDGIEYRVCKLTYIIRDDDSFCYIFEPDYSVIDLLSSPVFEGIPGLNLDLRKDKYIRDNIKPCFITERVPQENREDYWYYLDLVGLEYMNPIEYLVRTPFQYSGDNLYLVRYEDKKEIVIEDNSYLNNNSLIDFIAKSIAAGNSVKIGNMIIDSSNNKDIFKFLLLLRSRNLRHIKNLQKEGIEIAKQQNKYKGRKSKEEDIEKERLLTAIKQYKNKELSLENAYKILNISKSTFYRLMKKYDK